MNFLMFIPLISWGLLFVLILIFRKCENFKKWVFSTPLFVSSSFPLMLTIFFTLLLNIPLLNMDKLLQQYIPNQRELFWLFILINLFYAIITFWVIENVQSALIRTFFTKGFYDFIESTKDFPVELRKFAAEFVRNLSYMPDSFRFTKKLLDKDNISNIEELLTAMQTSRGASLENALYAELLKQSLIDEPHTFLCTWDTKHLPLDENANLYNSYFHELNRTYKSNNLKQRERIFLLENDNIASFVQGFSNSVVYNLHKEQWGFEKVYYCKIDDFIKIRKNCVNTDSRYDDFILLATNQRQWMIGKDFEDQRTRFLNDEDIIESTKKFYSCVVDFCNQQNQVINFK